MRIMYISGLIEPQTFYKLREKYNISIGLQQQKFHECFTNGLNQNNVNTLIISNFQVEPGNLDQTLKFKYMKNDNLIYMPFTKYKPSKVSNILQFISMIYRGVKYGKHIDYIFCDYINVGYTLSSVIISKIIKKPLVYIVTDVPAEYLNNNVMSIDDRIRITLSKQAKKCIFITNQISELPIFKGIDYFVYEGSITDNYYNSLCEKKKTVVYTGLLSKDDGILNLLTAWSRLSTTYTLVLIGRICDDEIRIAINEIKGVNYLGALSNDVCMKYQREATFLINTRLLDNVYNKYSFPSKVIEYLASGTTLLSTPIECLFNNFEYRNHIEFFEGDDVDSIYDTLKKVLSNPKEYLEKGKEAQKFMYSNKTSEMYISKMIDKLGL